MRDEVHHDASACRRSVARCRRDEQADLVSLFSAVRTTPALASSTRSVPLAKAMLQSPNFLYHWEIGPTKPARGSDGLLPLSPGRSRLVWRRRSGRACPTTRCCGGRRTGALVTSDQVAAQVSRMLADPQAAQSLYSFHLQWLFNMGFHVTDLAAVDAKPNSPLTDAAAAGLQTEFTQFISSVYAPPGDGTLKHALHGALRVREQRSGGDLRRGGTRHRVCQSDSRSHPARRIFTQVSFLAGIEDSVADNPIYRGLAIYTKALCGKIPPAARERPGRQLHAGGTTRQGLRCARDRPRARRAATAVFDPAGFAFENYDGAGRYRTTDGNLAGRRHRAPSQARPMSRGRRRHDVHVQQRRRARQAARREPGRASVHRAPVVALCLGTDGEPARPGRCKSHITPAPPPPASRFETCSPPCSPRRRSCSDSVQKGSRCRAAVLHHCTQRTRNEASIRP